MITFVIIVIFIWTIIGFVSDRDRFRHLAQQREGVSICQFARSFDCRKTDTRIIRAVYEALQDWAPCRDFPVLASDDMAEVYGICDEDLDYFAEEIAQKTGRSLKWTEQNPLYGQVVTAGDLVLFLNNQRGESPWKTFFL